MVKLSQASSNNKKINDKKTNGWVEQKVLYLKLLFFYCIIQIPRIIP